MEFVEYLLAFIVLILLWKKPQKECLAFGLLWVCIVADIVLYIVATGAGWLPNMAW